jgi:hypothetical protein
MSVVVHDQISQVAHNGPYSRIPLFGGAVDMEGGVAAERLCVLLISDPLGEIA